MDVLTYKIGFFTHKWWGHKKLWLGLLLGKDPHNRKTPRSYYAGMLLHKFTLLRRPHRPWQAEIDGALWAARAWTEKGAKVKMLLWFENGTDIKKHERRYGPRPDLWIMRYNQLLEVGVW